jgi:hypothetical protein
VIQTLDFGGGKTTGLCGLSQLASVQRCGKLRFCHRTTPANQRVTASGQPGEAKSEASRSLSEFPGRREELVDFRRSISASVRRLAELGRKPLTALSTDWLVAV